VKDWEGSGGGAEGRERKRERDRTQRENFTVIVWEGSGGGAGGRERKRKRDRIKRESKRASLHLWRNGVTIGPSMLLRGTFGYCVLLHE